MYCTDLSFRPDWAIPPGATISDILNDRAICLEQFAEAIGESFLQTNELLRGNLAIDQSMAERLGAVFGTTKAFWITREAQYRQDLKRLEAPKDSPESVSQWIKQLPIKDMVEFGWIPQCSGVAEYADEAFRFFDIQSISGWQNAFTRTLENTAFRKSTTFTSHEVAAAAWLRQGERQAEQIDCDEWNAGGFESQLDSIRALTRQKNPSIFLPKLQELCAASGVAVVVARAPSGCRASGATKFISPTKALLMLSFRYLSDDHFWFTFFHEAAHLLLHSKELIFLENKQTCCAKEEDEANQFSASFLIPAEFDREMSSLPRDTKAILRFARKVGVSPGVVVGQLQFRKVFDHSEMNHLKNRFHWG